MSYCFIHSWGEWEKKIGVCEEKRLCTKCGKEKNRAVGHTYGDWTNISGHCEEERVCTWCGERETKALPHSFGNWFYQEEGKCTAIRLCDVCGKKEEKTMHLFGSKDYTMEKNSCTTVQTCGRCGAKIIQFNRHEFTDWDYQNSSSCRRVRYCKYCGFMQYGEEEHKWCDSVMADGSPEPQNKSATYYSCLENAIKYIDIQIQKYENIKENIPSSEYDTKAKCIDWITELEMKKLIYKKRLESCDHNVLGDICERCWNVINWGITEEDLKKRVTDE